MSQSQLELIVLIEFHDPNNVWVFSKTECHLIILDRANFLAVDHDKRDIVCIWECHYIILSIAKCPGMRALRVPKNHTSLIQDSPFSLM